MMSPSFAQEIFDKQAELVEASAAAGKAVAKTVGDISQAMYAKNPDDKRWDEGGIYKVILQGAGAALVAQLGNWGTPYQLKCRNRYGVP